MERLLEKNGFSVKDILPFGEAKLLSFMDTSSIPEDKKKRIIELAEGELERPLYAIPISSFVGYYKGTHPETIPEFYEHRNGALALAIAESIEGQGRFVNKLLDLVWCILEETIWYHPAHLYKRDDGSDAILPPVSEEGFRHNVDLRTGATIGTLSLIYSYCRDIFDGISPLINQRIIKEVREKAITPYLRDTFWWTGERGGAVINWGPWITSNMLLTVACLESDEEIRRAVVEKCMDTLNSYTERYCGDGGCNEGPSYWGASCGGYLNCLDLLYDLSGGKINIYHEPHIRRMFEFAPKYNIHDKFTISIADAAPQLAYSATMLRRMGKVTGSELLLSFAGFMANYTTQFNFGCMTPYSCLRDIFEPPVEICEFKAAKRVWFPDLKVGYSRECESTSKGMFVCMVGGINGTAHNHNDLGSVIVYYGGKPVFIDMGAGSYNKEVFGPNRYNLTTHSSGYHNTVNIGGVLQRFGGGFKTQNESYDEETGFVTMDITKAYPEEAGINSYVRSAGIEGSVVKIIDSFDLQGEREIDIHFVTHIKPEIAGDGSVLLTEGRTLRFDERLTPEIEVFPALDKQIADRWNNEELYNIHLKGKAEKAVFVTTVE